LQNDSKSIVFFIRGVFSSVQISGGTGGSSHSKFFHPNVIAETVLIIFDLSADVNDF
jgi:hypothetical protein